MPCAPTMWSIYLKIAVMMLLAIALKSQTPNQTNQSSPSLHPRPSAVKITQVS